MCLIKRHPLCFEDDPISEKGDYSIRSIRRGFDVLRAINRAGSPRLTDISNVTSLPYPTVSRIVETLLAIGMIERVPGNHRYRPTALVQSLSAGYQEDNALVVSARPFIVDLCKKVGWPITVATRVGNCMMVRDSTHSLTTLTFKNYAPGYTLPLIECSVGKAYLAYCGRDERESIIASLDKFEDESDTMARVLLGDNDLLDHIRTRGYATHAYNKYTENPGKTSSLGVPILCDDQLVGCLGLVFFSAAMRVEDASEQFIDAMQATAKAIGEAHMESSKQ